MDKLYLSAYLDGIMNMASSVSKTMGPSYVLVDCYEKKEFKKYFNIELYPTTLSYEDKLKEWFINEDQIVESILHWTRRYVKKIKNIYTINDKDLEKFEKYTLFYTIEGLFIVETDKYLITYIIGDNE